jgi:hypothetical protein
VFARLGRRYILCDHSVLSVGCVAHLADVGERRVVKRAARAVVRKGKARSSHVVQLLLHREFLRTFNTVDLDDAVRGSEDGIGSPCCISLSALLVRLKVAEELSEHRVHVALVGSVPHSHRSAELFSDAHLDPAVPALPQVALSLVSPLCGSATVDCRVTCRQKLGVKVWVLVILGLVDLVPARGVVVVSVGGGARWW